MPVVELDPVDIECGVRNAKRLHPLAVIQPLIGDVVDCKDRGNVRAFPVQ